MNYIQVIALVNGQLLDKISVNELSGNAVLKLVKISKQLREKQLEYLDALDKIMQANKVKKNTEHGNYDIPKDKEEPISKAVNELLLSDAGVTEANFMTEENFALAITNTNLKVSELEVLETILVKA